MRESGALPQGEGAMLEPQDGIFGKALGDELLVSTKLRLTELSAPPPVRPLVEEGGRALREGLVQDLRRFMLCLHCLEPAPLYDLAPERRGDVDIEKVGDAPHLAAEVADEIGVVH